MGNRTSCTYEKEEGGARENIFDRKEEITSSKFLKSPGLSISGLRRVAIRNEDFQGLVRCGFGRGN